MTPQPTMEGQPAIVVRDLKKSYGSFEAVKGISFEVWPGEVFGLLGPNGAGKTTTIEILEGIRPATAGHLRVLGFDPDKQRRDLKDRIGVCLQNTNLQEKIRVREAVQLFADLFSRHTDIDALLKRMQLWEKRNAFYGTLSGGQKQRLALALALVNEPQLMFFDEPTAALDPQARLEVRSLIEQLRQERRTIVLTTHYIEEAERLCDRVAIMDEGRIIALGAPRDLQAQAGGLSHIEIRCHEPVPQNGLPTQFGRPVVSDDGRTISVASGQPARAIVELVKWVDSHQLDLEDIHLRRPTLEDVFLELTGKLLRD